MSHEGTEVIVFKAGQQELVEVSGYGNAATVAVWQGVGAAGRADKIGVGYATYRGRFDWTLRYDVAYYFLAGSLQLIKDGVPHTASVGDVMFIPRGSKVVYESPEGCRIFWVSYPGNWEEISEFPFPRDRDG